MHTSPVFLSRSLVQMHNMKIPSLTRVYQKRVSETFQTTSTREWPLLSMAEPRVQLFWVLCRMENEFASRGVGRTRPVSKHLRISGPKRSAKNVIRSFSTDRVRTELSDGKDINGGRLRTTTQTILCTSQRLEYSYFHTKHPRVKAIKRFSGKTTTHRPIFETVEQP